MLRGDEGLRGLGTFLAVGLEVKAVSKLVAWQVSRLQIKPLGPFKCFCPPYKGGFIAKAIEGGKERPYQCGGNRGASEIEGN